MAVTLAACAGLPATPSARAPRSIDAFVIEGRIAVTQGDNRLHANIFWQHDARHDNLLLTGPLGQGLAEFNRDETGARLITAHQGQFLAADWEVLAEQAFGTRLPLNDLPRWMAGQVPPVATGWRVEYLDYESSSPDALPTLIEFRREDIEVRVKIDQWSSSR